MGNIILFQGDSVTDAGRLSSDNGLGSGYVEYIGQALAPTPGITVLNKGISGNRAIDLMQRWQQDCVLLAPDILTILIGINDCWRKYDSDDETPASVFEEQYVSLLETATKETSAKIILMEPFLLHTMPGQAGWRETLDPEIQVVRKLALEYKTALITLDALFAKLAITHGCAALAADGVHPTPLGHRIIADAWLEAYRNL